MRTAVSRWENGHVVPEVHYRRLLCDIIGTTEEELGFARTTPGSPASSTSDEDLRSRIASSSRVDGALITLLQTQTDTIRRLDRRLGAPVLLDQMRAHVVTLE
jgi:transcriptional regulator with XRE-family HTH domain